MNPEDRWFTEGPYMLNNCTILHLASGLKLKPWKFKVDGALNGKGGGQGGGGETWKLLSNNLRHADLRGFHPP